MDGYAKSAHREGFFRFPEDDDLSVLGVPHVCCSDPDAAISVTIYDSRISHSSRPPVRPEIREAAYVCFAPAVNFTPAQVAQRMQMLTSGATSSHWPNRLNRAAPTLHFNGPPNRSRMPGMMDPDVRGIQETDAKLVFGKWAL